MLPLGEDVLFQRHVVTHGTKGVAESGDAQSGGADVGAPAAGAQVQRHADDAYRFVQTCSQ
jgi:hypothetical protein